MSGVRLSVLAFGLAVAKALAQESASPDRFAAALKAYLEHTRTNPPPAGRFETGIRAYLAADRTNPPPRGVILFIGSSIFKQWTNVTQQMSPLPAFNRAFGGSRTSDILERLDQVVLPYAPRVIVYYAGGNDINNREPAAAVFGRIYDFERRVHAKLPDTRILFVAIDRAPQKRERWDEVNQANTLIRDYCAVTSRLTFVDMNPLTHDANGEPRGELYRDDGLHFKPAAYVEFTAAIKPVLEKAWAEVNAGRTGGESPR
jgi:lysophospholipase L1-like esterase